MGEWKCILKSVWRMNAELVGCLFCFIFVSTVFFFLLNLFKISLMCILSCIDLLYSPQTGSRRAWYSWWQNRDEGFQQEVSYIYCHAFFLGGRGSLGSKGKLGPPGLGIPGIYGKPGEPGLIGLQGNAGLPGFKGQSGRPGIDGVPGKDSPNTCFDIEN